MEISPEIKEKMAKSILFAERTGIEVVDVSKGYAKLKMPIEGNGNHVNTMYAGALFTLAELPGGIVYVSTFDRSRYYPIVKDMYIKFTRPATTDVTIEIRLSDEEAQRITADAEENGKADYILEGELVDANGTVVALSKGTYQLRKIGT